MDSRAFQLNRLTDEQRAAPQELLKEIFTKTTLQEIRDALEEMGYYSLIQSEQNLNTTKDDILFVSKLLEQLAECAYILYGKKSK
jgi:hypothetical protein